MSNTLGSNHPTIDIATSFARTGQSIDFDAVQYAGLLTELGLPEQQNGHISIHVHPSRTEGLSKWQIFRKMMSDDRFDPVGVCDSDREPGKAHLSIWSSNQQTLNELLIHETQHAVEMLQDESELLAYQQASRRLLIGGSIGSIATGGIAFEVSQAPIAGLLAGIIGLFVTAHGSYLRNPYEVRARQAANTHIKEYGSILSLKRE